MTEEYYTVPVRINLPRAIYARLRLVAAHHQAEIPDLVVEVVRRALAAGNLSRVPAQAGPTGRAKRSDTGRPRRAWTSKDADDLRRLHAMGMSDLAIGRELGWSNSLISIKRWDLGLQPHFRGRGRTPVPHTIGAEPPVSMEHVLDAAALKELTPGKKMPGATKLALMAIGDDASDHTNLSYPGIEKVCDWANVEPRQAMKIINDLVDADFVERVSAASPGRRAVYRVKIPQRPRRAVDNSQKMGATERTHPAERMRYQGGMGATQRTPLRITSPVNTSQSSTEPTRDARESTTDPSLEKFRPENRTLLERMFKRPTIDLERLGRDMREFFEEAADVEPQLWLDRLDDFAMEILGKARGVQNPNAYVRAAILSDLPVFQKRMFDSFGRSRAHH